MEEKKYTIMEEKRCENFRIIKRKKIILRYQ